MTLRRRSRRPRRRSDRSSRRAPGRACRSGIPRRRTTCCVEVGAVPAGNRSS